VLLVKLVSRETLEALVSLVPLEPVVSKVLLESQVILEIPVLLGLWDYKASPVELDYLGGVVTQVHRDNLDRRAIKVELD